MASRPSTPSVFISDSEPNIGSPAPEMVHQGSASEAQEDLVQASAKNPSILLELDMDGRVKHLSKAWTAVVGTDVKKIVHRPISKIILGSEEDKNVFNDAIRIMMTDDESYRVRFVVATNDVNSEQEEDYDDEAGDADSNHMDDESSHHSASDDLAESLSSVSTNGDVIELEGQGILIHDSNNIPTHSMWILKPFYANSLNVELPSRLAESLGFGSEIFSSYLQDLSELGIINEADVPPPPQVLCRICEQQVPSWWLERHSQLCFNEHKCDSDVQMIHDALVEQRQTIASISESLSKESLGVGDSEVEYKGIPLPKVSTPTEIGKASPTISKRARSGSFMSTLRFPFMTLTLLLELCDTAIAVNPSEFNETSNSYDFSPNTKDAMIHIDAFKIPSSSDPAISLLTSDTEKLSKDKIDAVERLNSSLVYSQKIKDEVDLLVLTIISETVKNIRNQTYDVRPSIARTHSGSVSSDTGTERPPSAIAHPKPTSAQSNIFTDAYIGTDSLPTPTLNHRAELIDSRDRFSPSRSITPGDTSAKDSAYDNSVFNSLSDLQIKSPILTPQRKPSPGLPTGYHNSPMSSIQRNTRSYGGLDSSVSGTPISSPLILAHEGELMEKKPSAGENFLSPAGTSIAKPPLSPLLVAAPPPKASVPSIKDYEILKPISKGAFGSVFLARRKVTGDYFAIKVLKKADMIAKNQVTNVKAERAIMMAQSDSPYVARLYSSFQSKDYLFLVMEYLPGGDCSTMVKLLGGLPDEWAKQYIAEVIVGVDDLHQKGIVHHDLKPDNLLIDSNGHLKLTDFGLSRMGLVRRQERPAKTVSVSDEAFGQPTTNLTAHNMRQRRDSISALALSAEPASTSSSPTASFFDSLIRSEGRKTSGSGSQGSGSESPQFQPMRRSSSQTSFVLPDYETVASNSSSSSASRNLALFDPENSSKNKKFVGTPDYLAPETIRGTGENEASDWWSVGCILFEFLFGYPPFHANTPEKVFENILTGEIDWPELTAEEEASICSTEAKDLIKKLLIKDSEKRLGANGAQEIKDHPYLKSIQWETLFSTEGSFVPAIEDPESTEYFESRGAELTEFPQTGSDDENEEDHQFVVPTTKPSLTVKTKIPSGTTALGSPSTANTPSSSNSPNQKPLSLAIPVHLRERRPSKLTDNTSEFGSFQFRNLPALDKANKDVINRIKAEHIEHRNSLSSSSSDSGHRSRNYSMSSPSAAKRSLSPSFIRGQSPARGSFSSGNIAQTPTSASTDEYYFETSGRSSPSTDSGSPSTKMLGKPQTPTTYPHGSRNSRSTLFQRTVSDFSASSSDTEDSRTSALERVRKRRQSSKMSEGSKTRLQFLDVLLCEPIPIMRYSLKRNLESLGCAVVAVTAADELVRRATGEVKFDVILTALKMKKVDLTNVVKLLKHTSSVNSDTPVIALTAYYKEAVTSGLFTEVLEKPVAPKQLKAVLEKHCRLKVSQAEEAVSDSESDASGSGSGGRRTLRDSSQSIAKQ